MSPRKRINEEVINHFGAIRLHVTGSGNLKPTLYSLNEIKQKVLSPIPISNVTNREPNRLANFTEHRTKLELRTTEINEVFQISKIIIFTKPIAKSFPETT